MSPLPSWSFSSGSLFSPQGLLCRWWHLWALQLFLQNLWRKCHQLSVLPRRPCPGPGRVPGKLPREARGHGRGVQALPRAVSGLHPWENMQRYLGASQGRGWPHYLGVGCPRRSGGNRLHAFTEIDLHGGQWENWGWHKAFSWWILQIQTDKSPFFFTRFLPHTSWAVRVWQALSRVLETQTRTQSACCSDHKTSWERLILTKHRGGWRISTVTKYTKVRIRQL